MPTKRSQTGLVTLLSAAVLLAGCHKQPKPQPIVPPPMLPQSAMIPLPEVLPPADVPPVTVKPRAPAVTATKVRPKPRNGKKITDLPKTAITTPAGAASATVTASDPPPVSLPRITTPSRDIPNGGISDVAHSDELHHRQTAAQLNQSTEENLQTLNRALTAQEKAIVEQIRNFIAQSQAAIAENDMVRAHNLALKAHLLSDELAHR